MSYYFATLFISSSRYLYALQIRNDFFQGLLHSNRNTSLLLAAFIAQCKFIVVYAYKITFKTGYTDTLGLYV